jgi:hypothetical protein
MNLRTTVVAVKMSEITNFADISFAYGAGMNYQLKNQLLQVWISRATTRKAKARFEVLSWPPRDRF